MRQTRGEVVYDHPHTFELDKTEETILLLDRLFQPGKELLEFDLERIHGYVAEGVREVPRKCVKMCLPKEWHDKLEEIKDKESFIAYNDWLLKAGFDFFPEHNKALKRQRNAQKAVKRG